MLDYSRQVLAGAVQKFRLGRARPWQGVRVAEGREGRAGLEGQAAVG